MKRFSLSLILGFIVNNIVATMIAMFILNPFLNPMFSGTVRTQEDGLEISSLLSGYFFLTLLMVIGYKYFSFNTKWYKKGITWGLLIGGVTFVAGHLIIAGWAITPPIPMLISGILDMFAPLVTGVVISYFYRDE